MPPSDVDMGLLREAGNAAWPWDAFDSEWYYDLNYKTLRDDDRRIIEVVGNFFSSTKPGARPGRGSRAIDVGPGTNLYPTLAMLPVADSITLYERSASNVEWLNNQADGYAPSWDAFWGALATGRPAYRRVDDPRQAVKANVDVVRGSVFNLPENTWDLGTMFFVAESITAMRSEFRRATRRFIGSLRHYAPFAAAFMCNSSGYYVNGQRFPAVAITEDDITRCLAGYVEKLRVYRINSNDLRDGYDGMLVATGHARRKQ